VWIGRWLPWGVDLSLQKIQNNFFALSEKALKQRGFEKLPSF
jgi:hypothetical protein